MEKHSQLYGGNGNITASTAQRELQMPLALTDLMRQIERVGKAAEELSLRLEKVCRPSPLTDEVPPSVAVPQAEYVRELQTQADRIQRVSMVLENILSRLEL